MVIKRSSFRFKQFEIYQEHCAMKVGTDGVLLGAWCEVAKHQSILDIGTGTGLIAMMLAQRMKDLTETLSETSSVVHQQPSSLSEISAVVHQQPSSLFETSSVVHQQPSSLFETSSVVHQQPSSLFEISVNALKYTTIDAVEIDAEAAQQAASNVLHSPFANRITIINADIQVYAKQCNRRYDVIVCNPPYFTKALRNPDMKRATARHTDTLPFVALIDVVKQLLTPNGRFDLILPDAESLEFIKMAELKGLYPLRITVVKTTATSQKIRRLISFALNKIEPQEDLLVIASSATTYTDEYKALTSPFYLNF